MLRSCFTSIVAAALITALAGPTMASQTNGPSEAVFDEDRPQGKNLPTNAVMDEDRPQGKNLPTNAVMDEDRPQGKHLPTNAVMDEDRHGANLLRPEMVLDDDRRGAHAARPESALDDDRPGDAYTGPTTALAPEMDRPIAFPNPSFGAVTIESGSTALKVDVYDVSGRRIASFAGNAGRADWDGRDQGGRLVTAGVYFARVSAGTGSARTVRLVRK